MTDEKSKQYRAILPLLKGRVVDRGDFGFKIAIGGSTTITVQLNNVHLYDIKDGDLLQLYTEVLVANAKHS
jgi:hypothetical protein